MVSPITIVSLLITLLGVSEGHQISQCFTMGLLNSNILKDV